MGFVSHQLPITENTAGVKNDLFYLQKIFKGERYPKARVSNLQLEGCGPNPTKQFYPARKAIFISPQRHLPITKNHYIYEKRVHLAVSSSRCILNMKRLVTLKHKGRLQMRDRKAT